MLYKLPRRNWVNWQAVSTNTFDPQIVASAASLYRVEGGALVRDDAFMSNLGQRNKK